MHLLSKNQLDESYTSTWSMSVKLIIHLASNHTRAYTIYHIISSLMHSWYSFVHINAIGSPEGVRFSSSNPSIRRSSRQPRSRMLRWKEELIC